MGVYLLLKLVHIAAAVLFLGDVLITFVWKLRADRTRRPSVVAYAQEMVSWTDWWVMLPASVVLAASGFANAHLHSLPIWKDFGLLWGQIAFYLSGLIWIVWLLPIQHKMLAMARAFRDAGEVPAQYHALNRRWRGWGLVSIALPLVALALMVLR
jgi:uncharacterized membrane protein